MATCLSLGGAAFTKHNKSERPRPSIDEISTIQHKYSDNTALTSHAEFEFMEQQKLLISRVCQKPRHYVILSQKEVHDAIDRTLNKYPLKRVYWHWFNGRFEPVLDAHSESNGHALATVSAHDHDDHLHHYHNRSQSKSKSKSKQQLLRMNGRTCVKCSDCFRKSVKHEYMTQKDVLFLIKHALKLFIHNRGEYIQPNAAGLGMDLNASHAPYSSTTLFDSPYMHGASVQQHNHTDLRRRRQLVADSGVNVSPLLAQQPHQPFHAYKPRKTQVQPPPLPPSANALIQSVTEHQQATPISALSEIGHRRAAAYNASDDDDAHSQSRSRLSRSRTGDDINHYDLMNGNLSKSVPADLYHHHQQQQQRNRDHNNNKNKNHNGRSRLKQELSCMKNDYHDMLKEYNELQKCLSHNGIEYDTQSHTIHVDATVTQLKQSIYALTQRIDTLSADKTALQKENERLQSIIQQLQQQLATQCDVVCVVEDSSHHQQQHSSPISSLTQTQIQFQPPPLESGDDEKAVVHVTDDGFGVNGDDRKLEEADDDNDDNDEDGQHVMSLSARALPPPTAAFYSELMAYYSTRATAKHLSTLNLQSVSPIDAYQSTENTTAQHEFELFNVLMDKQTDLNTLIALVTSDAKFSIHSLCNCLPLLLLRAYKCDAVDGGLTLLSALSQSLANDNGDDDDMRLRLKFLSQSFVRLQKSKEDDACDDEQLISFWTKDVMQLSSHESMDVSDACYRHPLRCGQGVMTKLTVCQKFSSNAMVCALRMEPQTNIHNAVSSSTAAPQPPLLSISHILLDSSVDWHRYCAITSVYKYMNLIWRKERNHTLYGEFTNLQYKKCTVQMVTLNAVAVSPECGMMELLPPNAALPMTAAATIDHVNFKQKMKTKHVAHFMTSAAATYIATLVCGMKKQQSDADKLLIRVADCAVLQLGFEFSLGDSDSSQTMAFASTKQLKLLMKDDDMYDRKFVPMAVDAYMALRKNHKLLIKFAKLAFSYTASEKSIETFLKHRLKIFDNDKQKERKWNEHYVKQWITRKIINAANVP